MGVAQKASPKLRVGVVGLGRMGRPHALNVLNKVPQTTLVCACSPAEADLIWADEFLTPHGVRVTTTFEEMIETPGLDAVIIASATFLHTTQTATALRKGLYVLCEKPVCKTLEEVR
jgi:myo-inositol 2-dehydrogenase/D-chiro-inositol 1-dehydrogenase